MEVSQFLLLESAGASEEEIPQYVTETKETCQVQI